MIILPAIDIINKQPVRLYQGDYAKKEVVGESISEIARAFEKQGASYLHLVDLDGAKEGKLVNQSIICETAQSLSIPVEVGGGIRNIETAAYYLEHGVSRIILGTAAIEDEAFLKEAVARYQERVAVGLDCKNGYVCTRGWLNDSQVDYLKFAKHLESLGVQTIIFTDIATDGTLEGPNLVMLERLSKQVSLNIIASGGIKDLSHIKALKELSLYGAITGKAMYAGTLQLKDALRLCETE
ncbi:1-(5-phosphoribosyl)-5-[(5-phosphoribosylamino)methylideneamino]imidazole-4-carboxamide isomerase [bacterium c-19]|nr:1-(5-phosphoribosyl)-5-[(5-phosphoribosylamino)methylideneamino]imidazole-4-carboxamide isomerase [bacterium c-19]